MKSPCPKSCFILLMTAVFAMASQLASAQATARKSNDLSDLFSDVIVAKGKGFEINRSELDNAVITTKANRVSQGNPIPAYMNNEIEAQILDKLVTTKIILLKATKDQARNGKLNAEVFLKDLIQQHPSQEAFERQLVSTGMALDYFRKQLFEQAIVKEVIDADLKAGYFVPDEKAREFYQTKKEAFAIPERAELRNIYIPLRSTLTGDPLPLAEQAKRLTRAEEVQSKAATGEDFIKLVKSYSEDVVTKEKDGEVTIARGSNNPVLEDAVFSLKQGQVSSVIKTGTGYHIVKLIKIHPKEYQSFSEVVDRIKMQLEAEYVQQLLPDYLAKLKDAAALELHLD
jgi:peptidyl-prolyl cis-trans isomerase C